MQRENADALAAATQPPRTTDITTVRPARTGRGGTKARVGQLKTAGIVVAFAGFAALGVVGDLIPSSSDPATPATSFCDTHTCIASFDDGAGYIVQCIDGEWSHSGGIQGACSGHGGER